MPTIFVLRLALGLAIGWLLIIEGDLRGALIIAVFLGLSFAYFLRDDRRATLFDVLFALAALLAAVGYMFGLFEEEAAVYDELEHTFMAFSVSLAFYFLFYGGAVPRRAVAVATSVFTLGVTAGALWEVFEWVVGMIDGLTDTISDLVLDGVGALAAALVALVLRRRGDRLT